MGSMLAKSEMVKNKMEECLATCKKENKREVTNLKGITQSILQRYPGKVAV